GGLSRAAFWRRLPRLQGACPPLAVAVEQDRRLNGWSGAWRLSARVSGFEIRWARGLFDADEDPRVLLCCNLPRGSVVHNFARRRPAKPPLTCKEPDGGFRSEDGANRRVRGARRR